MKIDNFNLRLVALLIKGRNMTLEEMYIKLKEVHKLEDDLKRRRDILVYGFISEEQRPTKSYSVKEDIIEELKITYESILYLKRQIETANKIFINQANLSDTKSDEKFNKIYNQAMECKLP